LKYKKQGGASPQATNGVLIMSNYKTYNRRSSIQRRKIAQRNRIIVESVIGGVLFSISIFGLIFLAYGLSA